MFFDTSQAASSAAIRRYSIGALSCAARPYTAADIDRLADIELAHGHHAAAERLAHLAAELREGGR